MQRRLRPLVALLLAAATACSGDDGGTNPPPGADPNAVASVVVEPATSTLASIGATTTLTASARNSTGAVLTGRTFTWGSSAPNVATVNATSGEVTAVANGTSTITATVSGGTQAGTATVTVQQVATALTVQGPDSVIQVGATSQLTATARDARGGTVAGATVAWSSSATAVATVNPTTGLVTAVAPGNVTITGTSGTLTATKPMRVALAALSLVRDTTLSGTKTFASINIGTGVTVTASGPLVLASTGNVNIAGTLTGSCVPIEIRGDTAVTITGTILNGCDAGTTTGNLRIAATGELTLNGANIRSSGDIAITNDPTLTEAAFPRGPAPVAPLSRLMPGGIPFTRFRNSTVRYHGGGTGPNPAAAGTDGLDGGNGTPGRGVVFTLAGNAIFEVGNLLWGQDGGRGGNGSETAATDITVNGGNGANGGRIRVLVTGKLTYEGANNIVRAGVGGAGGNATAVTTKNTALPDGPDATAIGGPGGETGLVDIRGGQGIEILAGGQLIVEFSSGVGGNANATGAPGADALEAGPAAPAQVGGAAIARGGKGGDTPSARAIQQNVVGGPPIYRGVAGGATAGRGGVATAVAGPGGNGNKPQKDGAKGGAIEARGGNGGDAKLRDATNATIGTGGIGGDAAFLGGKGGAGWNDCVNPNLERGGNGGAGGDATGGRGVGGSGPPAGADGVVRYDGVANGGKAGDGAPPGTRGAKGGKNVAPEGAPVTIAASFQDGPQGLDCTPEPPTPTFADIRPKLPVSIGGVPAGTYAFDVLIAGVVRGSVQVSTYGPAGTHFVGQNPLRIGWSTNSGWVTDLSTMVIDGAPFMPDYYTMCLINSSVSTTNPVFIEELDANDVVLETTVLTAISPRPAPWATVSSQQLMPSRKKLKAGAKKVRRRGRTGDQSCEQVEK